MNDYQDEIAFLKEGIAEANKKAMHFFHRKNYKIFMKGINNPLTEADLACNDILINVIQKRFPGDIILSEENHDNIKKDLQKRDTHDPKRTWIIDPIDGTKEFIEGLPQFAISVGLVIQNKPELGFISNPANDFFIYGGKATGIFLNDQILKPSQKKINSLKNVRICFSRSEIKKGLFNFLNGHIHIQQDHAIGSVAYKLGLVAVGDFDLQISLRPKSEWDIAGGASLLRGLDYDLLDRNYNPIVFDKGDILSTGLIAGRREAILLYKKNFPYHGN